MLNAIVKIIDKFFADFNFQINFDNIIDVIHLQKSKYLNKHNINAETHKFFTKLDKNDIIDIRTSTVSEYEINKILMMDFVEYLLVDNISSNISSVNIANWCKNNYIRQETFILFLKNYFKLVNKTFKFFNKIKDTSNDNILDPNWFYDNLTVSNFIDDPFLYSLLQGYCFNIGYRISGSELFISSYNPHPLDLYKIKDFSSTHYETLCNHFLTSSNFILFLNKNPELEYISIIVPLQPFIFKFLSHIYNKNLEYDFTLYFDLTAKINEPKYLSLINKIVPIYSDILRSLKFEICP